MSETTSIVCPHCERPVVVTVEHDYVPEYELLVQAWSTHRPEDCLRGR